jgi:hypothetical protein
MDVETTIDVVIAPILMLLIWRHSMACCQNNRVDPPIFAVTHGSAAPRFAQEKGESGIILFCRNQYISLC